MSKFKVGDKVTVTRAIADWDRPFVGKTFGIQSVNLGFPVIEDRGFIECQLELFVEKPTIIKLPNGHKIVINKPYTIYTDGKVSGKAKCNPEDEWSTEEGIRIAVERYKEQKSGSMWKHTLAEDPLSKFAMYQIGQRSGKTGLLDAYLRLPKYTMGVALLGDFCQPETYSKTLAKKMDEEILKMAKDMGSWSKPKTLQERFPIGSTVEMVKKSIKPWTNFKIGTIASVTGYKESDHGFGMLVYCKDDMNDQYINPDDLRLING